MQLKVAKLEEIVMRLAAASETSSVPTSISTGTSLSGHSSLGIEEGSDAAYHGETSWEAVFKSINDIQSVLDTPDEPDHHDESEFQPIAPDIAIGGICPIKIIDIRSSLPSRQDADVLVTTSDVDALVGCRLTEASLDTLAFELIVPLAR